MAGRYLLRFDDIAYNMQWERYFRIAEVLEACAVRPILGVIPDNQDQRLLVHPPCPVDYWAEVHRVTGLGWEVAMHGYQHRCLLRTGGTLRLSRESELAGLPHAEQLDRLSRGQRILQEHGLRPTTFMAPFHSFDEETEHALVHLGFTAVTDGFALFPFRRNGLIHVPQLFAGPLAAPFGVLTFCVHLNTVSSGDLDRLIAFVERWRHRFISFGEACATVVDSRLDRVVGGALRRLVDFVRRGSR